MIQYSTVMLFWDLYNYYSMMSMMYNSYYYTTLAMYYLKKIKRSVSHTNETVDIEMQMKTYEDIDGWEVIDI